MKRFVFLLVIFAGMGGAMFSADTSPLRTLRTSNESLGWEGVGRLNIGSGSMCTGALIANNLVLTAAHCMYDKATEQPVRPDDIEFLANWRNGRASAYSDVRRIIVHPKYSFAMKDRTARIANDLALLELVHPIKKTSVQPFPIDVRPAKGAEVEVVSYGQDRAKNPSLQERCKVLARRSGTLILDCTVDFGSSGAPVFIIKGGKPHIVSVISAKAEMGDIPVSFGTNLQAPLAQLLQELEEGGGVFRDTPAPSRATLPQVSVGASSGTARNNGAKFLRP